MTHTDALNLNAISLFTYPTSKTFFLHIPNFESAIFTNLIHPETLQTSQRTLKSPLAVTHLGAHAHNRQGFRLNSLWVFLWTVL